LRHYTEGFEVGALIAAYKPAAMKWSPTMHAQLEAEVGDWPPGDKLMYMSGHQRCRHCKVRRCRWTV
jgi:hypothetical protein